MDTNIFWSTPIVTLITTWLLLGVTIFFRDGKFPWLCLLPLLFVAAWHLFIIYKLPLTKPELHQMFYYDALEKYGNLKQYLFNYSLLGIEALMSFSTVLYCLRLIDAD